MATIAGMIFGIIWVFAPNRGLISRWRRITKQRFDIDVGVLLTHIQREVESHKTVTSSIISLSLGWKVEYSKKVHDFAQKQKLLEKDTDRNLHLTEIGIQKAKHYNS